MGVKRALIDVTPLRESAAFRWLWTGQTLSGVGSAFTTYAVMLQIYGVTRASLAVGVLGIARAVPAIGVGLLGGSVADAMDRRRLALASTDSQAAASGCPAAAGTLPPATRLSRTEPIAGMTPKLRSRARATEIELSGLSQ